MKKIDFDMEKFKELIDAELKVDDIAIKMGVKPSFLRRKMFDNKIKSKHRLVVSEENKKLQSVRVKKWLIEKPENHPWRSKCKFKSIPCQKIKEFLLSKNIQFIEEFRPEVGERHFSIDIAMPDKMIALEINGNQHYEKNGLLKPYYQERHNLLEANGWIVYEIHYSACFDLNKLEEFFTKLCLSQNKVKFDYFNYSPNSKKETFCLVCSKIISTTSIHCRKHSVRPSKIIWPTLESLQEMLWQEPITKIAKKLGVSDRAVEAYLKKHSLTKPLRGYWLKKKSSTLNLT